MANTMTCPVCHTTSPIRAWNAGSTPICPQCLSSPNAATSIPMNADDAKWDEFLQPPPRPRAPRNLSALSSSPGDGDFMPGTKLSGGLPNAAGAPISSRTKGPSQSVIWDGVKLAQGIVGLLSVLLLLLLLTSIRMAFLHHQRRSAEETNATVSTKKWFADDPRQHLAFPDRVLTHTLPRFHTAIYLVDMAAKTGNSRWEPGESMQLRIYLPGDPQAGDDPSDAPAASSSGRACVLLPASGADGFHGMPLDRKDYLDEVIPFVANGRAVIQFSIDGELPNPDAGGRATRRRSSDDAFQEFVASRAGTENARFALEYALQHLPEVDPNLIFIVGHGSAGTLALQFAAVEPRLAGAVAMAPVTDLIRKAESRVAESVSAKGKNALSEFAQTWSPRSLLDKPFCPLMIVHSKQDELVPFADSAWFVTALENRNRAVDFSVIDQGSHHESLIDAALPKAVNWVREQVAKKTGTPGQKENVRLILPTGPPSGLDRIP